MAPLVLRFSLIQLKLQVGHRVPCACIVGSKCRLVVQALPLILAGGVGVVLFGARAVQWTQSHVFHVLPFGALTNFDVMDACTGILVSGLFMMYFGEFGPTRSSLVPLIVESWTHCSGLRSDSCSKA
jgi:hypothetical protein